MLSKKEILAGFTEEELLEVEKDHIRYEEFFDTQIIKIVRNLKEKNVLYFDIVTNINKLVDDDNIDLNYLYKYIEFKILGKQTKYDNMCAKYPNGHRHLRYLKEELAEDRLALQMLYYILNYKNIYDE